MAFTEHGAIMAESLDAQQEAFSRTTRAQLRQVMDALRELALVLEPVKQPIGFVTPKDKPQPKISKAKK